MIFKSDFLKKINFFFYKKKHLIIYTIIGFFSLIVELFFRKLIAKHISTNEIFLHSSLLFGILFAFYFNLKLNFNVPKIYLKKSLFYFFVISTFSYLFQFFLKKQIELNNYSFEEARIIMLSYIVQFRTLCSGKEKPIVGDIFTPLFKERS